MPGETKTLGDLATCLRDLQNTIEGTVDETIPQKLEKPWKSFLKTNEEVIGCVNHVLDFLEKHKDAEFEGEIREDFDKWRKKWQATNNVYGGLLRVMGECKTAMETWETIEKQLKKL